MDVGVQDNRISFNICGSRIPSLDQRLHLNVVVYRLQRYKYDSVSAKTVSSFWEVVMSDSELSGLCSRVLAFPESS